MSPSQVKESHLRVLAPNCPARELILTPGALDFIATLARQFEPNRQILLRARRSRQADFDRGIRPDFLSETKAIRDGEWKTGAIPSDLQDRRIEITGPVERKMIINALNSGARVFMADFEDSSSPTWQNMIDGQVNLFDAVRRTIAYTHPKTRKTYALSESPATLMVRPRGWHLDEKHVRIDGQPISASLFDFGLFFYHNARELIQNGSGPYFYLPKLESYREARLWNEVFVSAQKRLGIPEGTIKATVLIETITAAFEMDEILFELKDHSAGLNCGRWDYIFSFIKKFRADPKFALPDRGQVGMDCHFLSSYSQLLIQTCHRRGAHAMGGMAAQIPIKDDASKNADALAKVQKDKEREAKAGHDGTWVAHPGLIDIARREFDAILSGPHQIENPGSKTAITQDDLLRVPKGEVTEQGLRSNLEVGVLYVAAWLRGQGCVPIHNLMEDAATAEISRTQVWQWCQHGVTLQDGSPVDAARVKLELSRLGTGFIAEWGDDQFATSRVGDAIELFESLILDPNLAEFLTQAAYDSILCEEALADIDQETQ